MSGLADLEALGYAVDVSPDGFVAAVRGFGIATMVDPADAAAVARLADATAHVERRFQFAEPAAAAARDGLEQAGYTIARDDPSVDVFTVTPPAGSPDMATWTETPSGLMALDATVASAGR